MGHNLLLVVTEPPGPSFTLLNALEDQPGVWDWPRITYRIATSQIRDAIPAVGLARG